MPKITPSSTSTPILSKSIRSSVHIGVKVKRQDSAYFYALVESYEDLATRTTLDHTPGASTCIIDLITTPDQRGELESLLDRLASWVERVDLSPTSGESHHA